MKEAIIKQMTEIVRDTMRMFTDDFYKYDLNALKDYDERFIWQVAPSHTHLSKIGEQYLTEMLGTEEGVFAMCQRNTTPDAVLNYMWGDEELVYYYDGDMLRQITLHEAQHIWEAVRSWALFMWQVQNKKELPNDFKIPVHMNGSRKMILELLHDTEKSSNLMEALKSRRGGIKFNASEKVEIYVESPTSLYFERGYMYKGDYRRGLNGGIIFYNGKWHTHT